MRRISVHTAESVPEAASQLTEFTSGLQPAVPPREPAREAFARHTARDQIIAPQAGRVPFLNDR